MQREHPKSTSNKSLGAQWCREFTKPASPLSNSTSPSFARLTNDADNFLATESLIGYLGFNIGADFLGSDFFQLGAETFDIAIGLLHPIVPMIQFGLLLPCHWSYDADFACAEVHLNVVRMKNGLRASYSKPLAAIELVFLV